MQELTATANGPFEGGDPAFEFGHLRAVPSQTMRMMATTSSISALRSWAAEDEIFSRRKLGRVTLREGARTFER